MTITGLNAFNIFVEKTFKGLYFADEENILIDVLRDNIAQMKEILRLVNEAQIILEDKHSDLNDFGRLLDYTWKLKKGTGSKISDSFIDDLYVCGIKAGALGGKLLGAGGGGFLLFYVEEEYQENLRKKLCKLMNVPFEMENEGTTIVLYNPVTYSPRKEFLV